MSLPEQRLSLVTLPAADLGRSVSFYRDGLGWVPAFTKEEVCFFQLPGLVLGLWDRGRMSIELGIPEKELGPGGMEVAHNVRQNGEVDTVVAAFRQAGGTVLVPAKDTAWGGRSAHVADLDGHRWEIAWNPAWHITSDGRTQMA